jgi:hypothetical protein
MKVQCLEKEITGYTKMLSMEHEGETCYVEISYDSRDGFTMNFLSKDKEFIEMPEWADKYDNAERSLDYDLDEASGMWEYCPAIPSEMELEV